MAILKCTIATLISCDWLLQTMQLIYFLDGSIVIFNSQTCAKGEFLKSSLLSSIHRLIALNIQITQKGQNSYCGWMVEI